MQNPPRNAPCPCGSGKKYKKCCLPKAEPPAPAPRPRSPPTSPAWSLVDDPLDQLSNSVLGLLRDRRFDQALAVCRRLLDEYPDVVDGLERSAMVYAAMGDHAAAADYYRKTLDYITHPSRRDDYEGAERYQALMEEQERLAGRR